ncbi:MAG: phosphoribosyltransferase [Sphaerochaeta sp.]|jgi:hypoxanthine phosphoribosyltransferase
MNPKEYYVSYNTVHALVKDLAGRLLETGYDPDVIVAIGSGGFIPARIIKTFINRPIYAVGISYYGLDNKHRDRPTKIQWIDEVQSQLTGKKLLLIDEVDDSRVTLAYCIGELLKYQPEEIAVLVLHNKIKEKDVDFPVEIKRYFAGIEIPDLWIKYPWDANDILAHTEAERQMFEDNKELRYG